MGRKIKFVVEIQEKYVDQKKTPDMTKNIYLIYSTKHKKKLSDGHRQKIVLFLAEVKKKFANNKTLAPGCVLLSPINWPK